MSTSRKDTAVSETSYVNLMYGRKLLRKLINLCTLSILCVQTIHMSSKNHNQGVCFSEQLFMKSISNLLIKREI